MPTEEESISNNVYEIDFGGHCMAKITTNNNILKVIAAMNGWGDGIDEDKINIQKIS